jgi:general nucleoside transport system ATP-binding protein
VILASQVWTQVFWTSVLAGGLLAGVPLMFTALGEAISERAGVLNIGLEGMMLVGAYAGFLGAYYGHSMWFGYLAGMGAGMLASCFMVVLCVWLGLREGEILGVAGVDGNGQRALAEVIAGQRRVSAGDIVLYGGPVTRMNVAARQKLGLRYVTDDRLGEGIVGALPVGLNLFLKRVGERPYWRHGRIQRAVLEGRAAELVREFDVRTPFVTTRAATLSGGNIQKVLLARELSFHPKVVVFHKPTYGLDVRTTATVRDLIRKLADDGGAALVISTDLDELLEICDRIAVLSRGRLVGVVPNGPGAAEHVGELMVGGRAGLEAA